MTAVIGNQQNVDAVRFRDDAPALFGIDCGEGPCDDSYVASLRHHLSHAVEAHLGVSLPLPTYSLSAPPVP